MTVSEIRLSLRLVWLLAASPDFSAGRFPSLSLQFATEEELEGGTRDAAGRFSAAMIDPPH